MTLGYAIVVIIYCGDAERIKPRIRCRRIDAPSSPLPRDEYLLVDDEAADAIFRHA